MVQKQAVGLAAAAIVGGLAVARSRTGSDTDTEPVPTRTAKLSDAASNLSTQRTAQVKDAIANRAGQEATESNNSRGFISDYTVRAGVYLDHNTSDSTFAFEWRQD